MPRVCSEVGEIKNHLPVRNSERKYFRSPPRPAISSESEIRTPLVGKLYSSRVSLTNESVTDEVILGFPCSNCTSAGAVAKTLPTDVRRKS